MTSIEGSGMDQLIPVVGTMALLGSALVGGIFFGFSSFIMIRPLCSTSGR